MIYHFFKTLSVLNKALLPKIYRKEDFTKLSKIDWLIFGWKRWVTFQYLDAKAEKHSH